MLHTIQNQLLSVTVAEHGAELQSIRHADGTEYLWQGDPAYWRSRAINLFPYVARLTNDSYWLDGKLYHMDIHGFAPYRSFRLTAHQPDSMTFELTDDADTYAHYPRQFAFRIHYVLENNRLNITFEVENRDSKPMYFGLGGHPGFRVPLTDGLAFTDYRLRFSHPCQPNRVGFTETCFLNGTNTPYPLEQDAVLPLDHSLFDDDAIVLKEMDRQVTLETDSDGHSVTVGFPGMDYLGIWHKPHTDAPYVCIEPWCSLPSTQDVVAELETQPDLISLEPGKTYRNTWWIELQ